MTVSEAPQNVGLTSIEKLLTMREIRLSITNCIPSASIILSEFEDSSGATPNFGPPHPKPRRKIRKNEEPGFSFFISLSICLAFSEIWIM
jgi:hypothetical protein